MKTQTIIVIYILSLGACSAQTDEAIVKYFQGKKSFNMENFLFTTPELIDLCKDSVGQSSFERNLNRYVRGISSANDAGKEKKVLLTILNSKIKSISVKDAKLEKSKIFLDKILKSYLVDFEVNEGLLISRFKLTNERVETCDIETSLYIFFVYNPELYLKVSKKDKDLKLQEAPFPFSCTLENTNIPVSIRNRMKAGLLAQLKNYKEPTLTKIYNAIKKSEISEGNN